MKFRLLAALGLSLTLGTIGLVSAQDAGDLESMRFVDALRKRGDNDLARLYLKRLAASPNLPPALAQEIPLEIAKLRLLEASVEPDSGKRQSMLNEARQEFEQFLTKHPQHRRAAEVRLEIAQVMVQQGRILLSKSLSQDTLMAQRAEGARARIALEEAGRRLAAVAKEMDGRVKGLGDPKTEKDKAERRRLDEDRMQAHFAVAQNLFDQAMTYSRDDQANFRKRGDKVLIAQNVLESIANSDSSFPQTWAAKAWVARCFHEYGKIMDARVKLKELIALPRATEESRRLARYFLMLALEESTDKNKATEIEDLGREWLRLYDRNYRHTPEGYGVRYLMAAIHLGRASLAKQAKQKEDELTQARNMLREVEAGDNEFSERARRKKLTVMKEQGAFDKKIEQLKTFEDCYVRAQFEMSEIERDVQKILHVEDKDRLKDPDAEAKAEKKRHLDAEKARQHRIDQVLTALDRGLALPEVRGKRSSEISNAHAYQAFWAWKARRFRDSIRYGETFARDDAQAGQAANAAMYALQCYSQMIRDKELMLDKGAGDLTDDNGRKVDQDTFVKALAEDKKKMTDFARYVQKVWPKEQAGELAMHQLAILLFNEKAAGEQQTRNFHEAIRALLQLPRTYPDYGRAMFLLALKARDADKNGLPPLEDVAGKKVSWKQRSLDAYAAMPQPSGEDPEANLQYLVACGIRGNEMYKEKKFAELDQLVTPLLDKVPAWAFNKEEQREKAKTQMLMLRYFSRYGLADAAFQANAHAKVLEILDPIVDEVKRTENHPIKSNEGLGQAMLNFAMRSAMLTNKQDRARACLAAIEKLTSDDPNGIKVIGLVLSLSKKQLEEVKQKGDKGQHDQLIKGYSALLDDLQKTYKLTPPFILRLAQCYSQMDRHAEAITRLKAFPEPKKDDAEAEKLYHSSQLNLIREYRLNKEIKKARPVLEKVLGTPEKPGWGAKQLDALLEMVYLLNEEEKYAEAYGRANKLVKALGSKVDDNTLKERYLECYYQQVYAIYKFAQNAKDEVKKERNTQEAAKQIVGLETRFPGFGDDATAQRFKELLEKEPALNKAYQKIKSATPAGK